jgi:hypothetical protein
LCTSCDFKSEPGKGSDFWFDVLVSLKPASNAEPEPLPSEKSGYFFANADLSLFDVKVIDQPESIPMILEGKTVLVVDDSEVSLKFTANALERMGCTTIYKEGCGLTAIKKVWLLSSEYS